jgi:flotillin
MLILAFENLVFKRMSLNTMTLTIESPQVYTMHGVAISVTGIAQVS